MTRKQHFEKYGREYGRYEYEHDRHDHETVRDDTRFYALGRDDERHFAARHHAHARDTRFTPRTAFELNNGSAADYLAQQPRKHEERGHEHQPAAQPVEGNRYSYRCKKHGTEYHVTADVHFFVRVVRHAVNGGEHDARYIRARDIRHAEYLFRGKGIGEARREPEQSEAVRGRPFFIHPCEQVVQTYAHGYRGDEEGDYHDDRSPPLRLEPVEARELRSAARSAQPRHDREHDHADNVVYDRGADEYRAYAGIYLSQLFEHGNGYRDARRRKYRTHEQSLYDRSERVVHQSRAHERQGYHEPEHEGHSHARARHESAHEPRFSELFKIGLQPRAEHDEYHAYFGKDVEYRISAAVHEREFVQHDETRHLVRFALKTDERIPAHAYERGSDEHSGDYIAEHLRKIEPAEEQAA